MLGCDDAGFAEIQATAFERGHEWINLGSTRRLLREDEGIASRLYPGIATAHDIKVWPQAVKLCSSWL